MANESSLERKWKRFNLLLSNYCSRVGPIGIERHRTCWNNTWCAPYGYELWVVNCELWLWIVSYGCELWAPACSPRWASWRSGGRCLSPSVLRTKREHSASSRPPSFSHIAYASCPNDCPQIKAHKHPLSVLPLFLSIVFDCTLNVVPNSAYTSPSFISLILILTLFFPFSTVCK